jgi:NhaA family Na+:H+ antiporter
MGSSILGHEITPHFLINDIFMVFFFGIAAKEITESCLPGGPLNPPSKAINPLLGTIGGVVGPIGVFFLLTSMVFSGHADFEAIERGWGIPTATDIALAWLAASLVFGPKHPAVSFLLLLAVADDAIGLGIIAVFYPDPNHPAEPQWLILNGVAMAIAYGFRRWSLTKQFWSPTIIFAGGLSWLGLMLAHLHPALALVPIVPFLPGPMKASPQLYDQVDYDVAGVLAAESKSHEHSALSNFEHKLKLPVDLGLFLFAFANAGVEFSSVNEMTWIILASLLIGKTVGIGLFSFAGDVAGFPLPKGMGYRHLLMAGLIAGLGLTVALFVAGEAYPGNSAWQGPAKMGAVFSASAGILAIILAPLLGIRRRAPASQPAKLNDKLPANSQS